MKFLSTLLFSLLAGAALASPIDVNDEDDVQANHFVPVETLFPHYLVPLSEASPNIPFGNQYTGTVQFTYDWKHDEITTIAGFDVPNNVATVCFIRFRLPQVSKNSWAVSGTGSGKIDVYGLSRPVNPETDTWNYRPVRSPPAPLATIQVVAGGEGIVTGQIPCSKGRRLDFELVAQRPGSTYLHWFELDAPKTGITVEMY